MKLSICTDVFGKIPYTEMLDRVQGYGIHAVEISAGGWGGCFFIPSAEELIRDDAKREAFLEELKKRDIEISALNCSGNPLVDSPMGRAHSKTMRDTFVLAGKLGVRTVVTMSGLPEAAPGEHTPNWITTTCTEPVFEGFNYKEEALKYQWDVAAKWWRETCRIAKDNGVEKIALEEFPNTLVCNVRSLFQLCEAVGPEYADVLGLNLDPSHLIIQGADPIASARALGDKIFYLHGKDARIERGMADVDGLNEPLVVTETARRTWNYVAVGCGQDLKWWKEFFSVCRMMGYNGYVALEMEDQTMSVEAGLETSINALRETISQ